MKILINTASTFKGGGVQVANSFIKECKNHPGNEYHVILGANLAKGIDKATFPENFHFYDIDFRPATRVFSLKSGTSFFKAIENKVKPDVVFTTSGPAYWRPEAPHLTGYNLPHYIYPESPFFKKLSVVKKLQWFLKGKLIVHFFKRDADAYVVQTDDVNERLRKLLNTTKVFTVSNTCSAYYYDVKFFENKLPLKKETEYRLLTLSAWYPHKNLTVIPKVIDRLLAVGRTEIRFVVTLPEDIYQTAFEEKYKEYILNAGVIPVEQGPSLYAECDAMFLPTLLECFSASYAEAMIMKKPVVTSDMGFARTICADAALYFDPVDPVDIASKITELTDSERLQEELILKGLERIKSFGSAAGRAQSYLDIAKSIMNK